ncbi:hypothetical protein MHLNE_03480 [Moorella humiferrea]
MKRYSEDFRQQVIFECEQVGNIALVARRNQISEDTATCHRPASTRGWHCS